MRKIAFLVCALGLLVVSTVFSAVPVSCQTPYEDPPTVLPIPAAYLFAVPFGISNSVPPVIVGYAQLEATTEPLPHENAICWVNIVDVWTFCELETPDLTVQSHAQSVNDNGWIAGFKWDGVTIEAWLWKINPLTGEVLSSQGLGWLSEGTRSSARSINNQGDVVGISNRSPNPAESPHGFLWRPEKGMVDLGVFRGDEASYANDLTENSIVGVSVSGTGVTTESKAVIWTKLKANPVHSLPFPAGDFTDSWASCINEDGLILGNAIKTGVIRAVLWTPFKTKGKVSYTVVELASPWSASERYESVGINDDGTTVIQGWVGSSAERACVLLDKTSTQIVLNPAVTGEKVHVHGINNQGIVIGAVDAAPPGNPTPVFWLP